MRLHLSSALVDVMARKRERLKTAEEMTMTWKSTRGISRDIKRGFIGRTDSLERESVGRESASISTLNFVVNSVVGTIAAALRVCLSIFRV